MYKRQAYNLYAYSFCEQYKNRIDSTTNSSLQNFALDAVNLALNLVNDKSHIWDTRGEIYYHLGEYQKCIDDMTKAINISSNGNSHLYRGLAFSKISLPNTFHYKSAYDDLKLSLIHI